MRARRSGQIIWISSTLGRVLRGRGGLYPATKWAAEGLAETLHRQIAPFGIDLTILEPDSYADGAHLQDDGRRGSGDRRGLRGARARRPMGQRTARRSLTTGRTRRKWPRRSSS